MHQIASEGFERISLNQTYGLIVLRFNIKYNSADVVYTVQYSMWKHNYSITCWPTFFLF